MKYLLSAVLIPIVISLLFSSIGKKNDEETIKNLTKEHIVIRYPKVYLWVGIIDIFLFAFLMVLTIWWPTYIWVWVLLSFFLLLGVYVVFVSLCWKIDIFQHEDYFLIRTLPFRTHKIQYSDCIEYGYVNKMNMLVLKTSRKKFHVDIFTVNFSFLVGMLGQHKVPPKIKPKAPRRKG